MIIISESKFIIIKKIFIYTLQRFIKLLTLPLVVFLGSGKLMTESKPMYEVYQLLDTDLYEIFQNLYLNLYIIFFSIGRRKINRSGFMFDVDIICLDGRGPLNITRDEVRRISGKCF